MLGNLTDDASYVKHAAPIGGTDEDGALLVCRICFEESEQADLISPCRCKGTQRYVHLKCLRRWQDVCALQKRVLMMDAKRDDRAARCCVCRQLYSVQPRVLSLGWRAWAGLRYLVAAAAVTLLAFGLSGPPWPHVAVLLLLMLGVRSHSLLAVLALALACVLAVLHARGLRVMMRVDTGGRLGFAVIRHGAPVDGLGPGVLLAASDDLERSIFRRSVVLLYRHSRRGGAHGVILSQPLGPLDPRVPTAGPGGLPAGAPALAHFLGGPVGLPGDGPHAEVAVMHTLATVPGACVLLPPAAPGNASGLYEGGSLADVMAAAGAPGASPGARVALYHGVTAAPRLDRKHLFYVLSESAHSRHDPLVLWLNGGPGCSSMIGWAEEHGPFTFAKRHATTMLTAWQRALRLLCRLVLGAHRCQLPLEDVVLSDNPYAWNTQAHMLYVDSPAGAGLSYSEDFGDYATSDEKAVADLHAFLGTFLELHPHLQANDFYMSGESYAGVYVPLLAQSVLRSNSAADALHKINLKGYMVGNPTTNRANVYNSEPHFALYKALIGRPLFDELVAACDNVFHNITRGSECERLHDMMREQLHALPDPYWVLSKCPGPDDGDDPVPAAAGAPARLPPLAAVAAAGPRAGQGMLPTWAQLGYGGPPTCTDHKEVTRWLNSDEVRAVLHAAPRRIAGDFQECTDRLKYNSTYVSMVPVHRQLLQHGLRALIYSGDCDLVIPHPGTELWTRGLGMRARRSRPWRLHDYVAGHVYEYMGNLTFATVLGAGHEVPQTNPVEALALFTSFIAGSAL
ncbi:hypothetical protein WJX81_006746 [Elliptochloris bilobata]|uniref:Carboxypeptidase n=1 Tax=Elliptochloris bilobata TaxID=381761 RepID=A0AAW1QPA8_9CHLO